MYRPMTHMLVWNDELRGEQKKVTWVKVYDDMKVMIHVGEIIE